MKTKFLKLLERFRRNIANGRFGFFSKKKKHNIYKRLKRYANQLSVKLRWTAGGIAIFAASATPSFGQIFTEVIDTLSPFIFHENPFEAIYVNGASSATFGDIDGDGDLDVFMGEDPLSGNANIYFCENIGDSANMILADTLQNPFGLSQTNFLSRPALIDIDGDGDLDMFVGDGANNLNYFENTGTFLAPIFSAQGQNPFGLNIPYNVYQPRPAFVDIDDDGDFDLFLNYYYGALHYFENQGTNTTPSFAAAQSNAFGLTYFANSSYSDITFQDIDNDGDLDLFGGVYGSLVYHENIGSKTLADFSSSAMVDPFNIQSTSDEDAPQLVDIDADGDLDYINGSANGGFFFQKNDSGSAPPTFEISEVDVLQYSAPVMIDIDNDGDLDAFVANFDGLIYYYKNIGTSTIPVFDSTQMVNPFGITPAGGFKVVPTFADIDGDGDKDLFAGNSNGDIRFYENTGDAINPVFALDSDATPFGLDDVGSYSAPVFIDIDNDGDLDVFSGEGFGNIIFYENAGTATAPSFSGSITNPFGFSDVGFRSALTFVDFDKNGVYDAFVGEADGNINFFENQGTATAPSFALSSATSPFGLTDVGGESRITFGDLDNDNNIDATIGNHAGVLTYFKNTTVLPVELTFFRAERNNNKVNLIWQTASEQNNAGFEIQRRSKIGNELLWKTIGFVEGTGSTTQTQFYSFQDMQPQSGLNYYRLKQLDFDEKYEYSSIEVVQMNTLVEGWTIFPNPVNELLQIMGSHANDLSLQLIDGHGKVIRSLQVKPNDNFEMNVSDLPSGQYHLQIQDSKTDFLTIKPITIFRK